ncbi:MAG: serine/threonine protein kinase [Planctomycetes bacterium]|nr:serine/threonine protein kinase [Planctomycetota bacterium]
MLVGQTIGTGAYRFEVERELGSGAMGAVYLAQFHRDGSVVPVALKVVLMGLHGNEGAMARFEREANILKQLKHPHIVRLHATGTYRKTPFIAMEYIDGEPLDKLLGRRGRLGWEEVVVYSKHLCEALQYAHDKGIIHRDLKPSNLMLTSEGDLKLTDFGIAKDTDVTALTGANSTIGTAAYMSPEQCRGDKNLTNKSDLYSLGIVMYELLTGRKPFMAETTVDMFLKHVNDEPPRIGKQVADLPSKLEMLILQLMAKHPDERPTDGAWVVRMLNEVEEDFFTRKSAGLAAVTNRRADRPRNFDGSKLDDEDKDAARALRGKKKKTKKKEVVPFFQKQEVKIAGIVLLLAAMLGGAFIALKPPSASKLAKAMDDASTPEDKLEAATKYLERHGDTPGEMTDRAATVFRDAATRKREDQLTKRFVNKMQKPDDADDKEAYEAAWQAMEAERNGLLSFADEFWKKVKARFPEEAKLPFALKDEVLAKARWGWVADKKLADLRKVAALSGTTAATIKKNRQFEIAFPTEQTNPEALAIRGYRLEAFGDGDKAGRVWEQLATLTEKDSDKREWYLLACQQRVANPKSADGGAKMRPALVEKHVVAARDAAAIAKASPDDRLKGIETRNLCREIVDLYDDEADAAIKGFVKQAKEIAATVPK